MSRLIVTLAILAVANSSVFGTSYYFPKFGTPIVSGMSIVFTEPGWKPHRIISVDRASGSKNWEIVDPAKILNVWIAPRDEFGNRYVITSGSDIFFCNPEDGHSVLAFRTGLKRCSVKAYRGALVFIKGEKDDVDWLQLVDLQSGKKIWEVPEVQSVTSTGGGLIICQRVRRKVNKEEKSYEFRDVRLTAITDENGRVIWEHKLPKAFDFATSYHVGAYVLVEYSGTIFCYHRDSGKLLKNLNLSGKDFGSVAVSQESERILAWHQGADFSSGGTVYEISVPELTKQQLVKTDWYAASSHVVGDVVIGETIGRMSAYNLKTKKKIWDAGQWAWDGVHDGHIYYSAMDRRGKHAVLKRIRVQSGKEKLLYRELLPKEMQW